MLGMAKKKRTGSKPDRSADRHAPHKMVRIPPPYHEKLKALSKRTKRSITAELLVSLDEHFRKNGIEPPADKE